MPLVFLYTVCLVATGEEGARDYGVNGAGPTRGSESRAAPASLAAVSADTRVFVRLRFSELFSSFFRAVATSGGMGSRARSSGSSSCRRSGGRGREVIVGVSGGARNVNNVQKMARSAFLRQ